MFQTRSNIRAKTLQKCYFQEHIPIIELLYNYASNFLCRSSSWDWQAGRVQGLMKDETAVLAAAASLDANALSAIFDEYAPAIFKYLLRLGLQPQEADQVVGDVFARLLEKFAEGAGPRTNLRSYLFQIAYHLLVDDARGRQHVAALDDFDTLTEDVKSVQAQTEEKMLFEKITVAMERELTEEQRIVLVLRFQEDFSLKETAEIIGKNVNAVKALQNRGINSLREALHRENGGGQ